MPVERTTPQLVKKGKGKKRPGYRGDAGYRSGSAQASSIGQGNVGSKASFGGGKGRDRSGRSEGASGADRSRVSAQQEANHRAAIAAAQEAKRKEKNKNLTKFGYQKPKSNFRGILGTIAGMLMGIPGLGLLTGGLGKIGEGLGSLNDKIQSTDFARSKTLMDYLDAKKYGGIDARDRAASKNMREARAIQKAMDMRTTTLDPRETARMGLQTIDTPTQTFSFDNSGMTKNDLPSNNYLADAYSTPTEGAYGFNLIELDKLKKAGYDPKEVYEGGYGKDLIKSLEPSGYTDADFTNEYGYPMTAGLLNNIGVRPAIKTKDTGLGFSIPTGDVGLNASGRLGNLSATVDAIDALKGESVNPQINYSGDFGNTTAYGNFSDDVQNIGLNFSNDKGLSGGISYDAITGEPRFDIGFRRTFADGGIASMFTRRR